jgi:3-oxoadipate enol-lactonase
MPFADSNGVKIYYEAQGQGDPLVLIQGYGHHLLHWAALPEQFAGLQYKVILIDNRGVGRSDKPDAPVTIAQKQSFPISARRNSFRKIRMR